MSERIVWFKVPVEDATDAALLAASLVQRANREACHGRPSGTLACIGCHFNAGESFVRVCCREEPDGFFPVAMVDPPHAFLIRYENVSFARVEEGYEYSPKLPACVF